MYIDDEENLKKLEKLYGVYEYRELTKEELYFLYFSGFVNPRMDRIRAKRNKKEDLARIFDCSEDEIGLKKEDLYSNQLVFFDNFIIYNNMYDKMRSMGFYLPKYTRFGVILPYVKSTKDLILPEVIGGTLALPSLDSIEGLDLPQKCRHIDLNNIRDGNGLVLSDNIGAYELQNLDTLIGVTLPERRLSLFYHDSHYFLEAARKLQEEEMKTYDPNQPRKVKKYGYRHNWYYKNG